MHLHPRMRACAKVQQLCCIENYGELSLSLVQALCRLSFAARPPVGPTLSRPMNAEKPIKIHASL